jgi:hypothetical protein
MCRNWISVMDSSTRTRWGIPADQFAELETLFGAAETMLQKTANQDERTRVVIAQCRAAFAGLDVKMRYFHDRFFKLPPLSRGDWAALGFRQRGGGGPVPRPEAQPETDIVFPGIHLVELRNIRPVGAGLQDPRSAYGVRIHYGLSGPPGQRFRFRLTEEPKGGGDLPYSIFTRRKKERFDFDGESGNRVYFCLCYENAKGEAGPFGPILSAVIP